MKKRCLDGNHELIVISSSNEGYDSEKVTRWCPDCGGIVVDLDYDGRTNAGYYMKMRFPTILKNNNEN